MEHFLSKIKNFLFPKQRRPITLSPRGECFMAYCQNIVDKKPQNPIAAYEEDLEEIIKSSNIQPCSRETAALIWLATIYNLLENGMEV